MYHFVFDKKSMALFLAGLALVGGLIFFGGLLAGVNWSLPTAGPAVAQRPRVQPADFAAERPCPEPASAPAVLQQEPAFDEPILEEGEPEPEPYAAEEEPVRFAALEPPAPPAEREPHGPFSVQVGAFRVKANSDAVLRDLEDRGYEPYVIELTSANRQLHTVRIGRYGDRTEASEAASEFRRREKMAAIVQPVGSY
jgi:cell division septation protein DedD